MATAPKGLATLLLATHRPAGVPGKVVPDASCFPVAIAVLTVSHVIEGQVLHVAASFEQAALRIFDGPVPRPQVADDLNGSEDKAVAFLQPASSPAHRARELGAHGASPDKIEVPWLEDGVIPLQDVFADGGVALRVRIKTRNLPAKGLEGSADALRAGEQLQQSHAFPRATTKATWPR